MHVHCALNVKMFFAGSIGLVDEKCARFMDRNRCLQFLLSFFNWTSILIDKPPLILAELAQIWIFYAQLDLSWRSHWVTSPALLTFRSVTFCEEVARALQGKKTPGGPRGQTGVVGGEVGPKTVQNLHQKAISTASVSQSSGGTPTTSRLIIGCHDLCHNFLPFC